MMVCNSIMSMPLSGALTTTKEHAIGRYPASIYRMDQRPPTPRSRKPRKTDEPGEQTSVALALTGGQLAEMDGSARLHGVSRRTYLRFCLEPGLAMISEGEVAVLGESISANAAFISVRVDADLLRKLDKIVIQHESNRRWVASVAILAGRAERLRTGQDAVPDRSQTKKQTEDRLALVERRLERLERIVADKLH